MSEGADVRQDSSIFSDDGKDDRCAVVEKHVTSPEWLTQIQNDRSLALSEKSTGKDTEVQEDDAPTVSQTQENPAAKSSKEVLKRMLSVDTEDSSEHEEDVMVVKNRVAMMAASRDSELFIMLKFFCL